MFIRLLIFFLYLFLKNIILFLFFIKNEYSNVLFFVLPSILPFKRRLFKYSGVLFETKITYISRNQTQPQKPNLIWKPIGFFKCKTWHAILCLCEEWRHPGTRQVRLGLINWQSPFVAVFYMLHLSSEFYLAKFNTFCVDIGHSAKNLSFVSLQHTLLRIFRVNTQRIFLKICCAAFSSTNLAACSASIHNLCNSAK